MRVLIRLFSVLFLSSVVACGSTGGDSSGVTGAASSWMGTRQHGPSTGLAYGAGISTDSLGNVTIAGTLTGALDGVLLGVNDGFATRYNSSGEKQWTVNLGVSGATVTVGGMTTDSANNFYLAGGTDTALDGNLQTGVSDAVVSMYDVSGVKQWTRQFGLASKSASAIGVTTDSSQNVYLIGLTNGALDGQTYTGSGDIFLTKFDSTATKQWTRLLGPATTGSTSPVGVATDNAGNVYIVGYTNSGATIDGYSASGDSDIVIAKYNSSGTKLWSRQFGAVGASALTFPGGIAIDSSNNIYIAGGTSGGTALDGTTRIGTSDGFIVKYNSYGLKMWTREFGVASGTVGAGAISIDSSGNLFIAGATTKALDGNTLTGTTDFFVMRFDSSGNRIWTKQLGAAGQPSTARGIALDSTGDVYVGGGTWGNLDGNTLAGSMDYFITKYTSAGVKQ